MKISTSLRAGLAALTAAAALAVPMASPAHAAGELATGNIGSSPALTLSNTWTDVNGGDRVVTVTAYFSGHTASAVTLDSVQLCYSGPAGSSAWISPYTSREGGDVWDSGPAQQFTKGDGIPAPCRSWTVGKTYTVGSSGEVVRVVSRITSDGGTLAPIAGYYR